MGLPIQPLNSQIKKQILLFFFLFISLIPNFNVYPQVRISEKVNIVPKIPNQMVQSSNTETHVIKAIVEWDTTGGTKHWLRAKMKLINSCNGTQIESDYEYDGYIELELSTDLASRFDVNVYTESNNYPIDNSWFASGFGHDLKIYADGILVEETAYSTSVVPWRSGISLRMGNYSSNNYDDALCFEEGVPFYVDDIKCETANWTALANSVNVSIVEEGEFTSFYSYYTDEALGDNLTFTTDIHGNYNTAWGTVHLNYDEEYSESNDPKEVVLEATVGGYMARDTILIFPSSNIFKVAGEIQDYKQSLIRWEKLTINAWLESSGYCGGIVDPLENTTFTAEVIKGSKYGGLINPSDGNTSTKISGLQADNGQVSIEYFADGEIVENSEEVLIKITSSIEDSESEIISFTVKPPGLFIKADPEEISLSDSSNIEVFWYNEMDSLELVPDDYAFQVEIIEGAQYGDIFDPINNESGDLFNEIYQGFSFKSDSLMEIDSAAVYIRVSTLVFGGGFVGKSGGNSSVNSNKSSVVKTDTRSLAMDKGEIKYNKSPNSISKVDQALWATEVYGIVKVAIKKQTNIIEIMLGETKYFQAKQNSKTKNIKIVEIEPDENGVPKQKTGTEGDWNWLTENIWGENPVEIVSDSDIHGKQMGVYWEREKPIWLGSTNKGKLATGLIRVIGRFWHQDSIYVVCLKAGKNTDSVKTKLKIVKPEKLVSKGQKPELTKYVDVSSNVINIDSLCIKYGGIFGIPPHFIKGHLLKEAAKKDFGGDIDTAFCPSFRYEPFTVQYWSTLKNAVGRFYFKDSLSVNYSDVPQHENVNNIDYIRNVKTVWDMVEDYSQLVNPSNPSDYGYRRSDHSMNFYPKNFKGIQRQYDKLLLKYEDRKKLSRPESADSANAAMVKWFKKEWVKNSKKADPTNTIAQTRAASSYGLLQLLYTTAKYRLKDYIANKVPEKMNEVIFFYYSLEDQKKRLIKYLTKKIERKNNWVKGYELSFKNSIYIAWNESNSYSNDILNNSKKFIPNK